MKETIWEGIHCGKAVKILVETTDTVTTCEVVELTEGFLHDVISKATTFAKAHPFVTGMMAGWAWDAIKKYNEARKSALHFYASDIKQRAHYEKLVKDLTKSSGYKVVKQGYAGGTGYSWTLHKR